MHTAIHCKGLRAAHNAINGKSKQVRESATRCTSIHGTCRLRGMFWVPSAQTFPFPCPSSLCLSFNTQDSARVFPLSVRRRNCIAASPQATN